jgi:hypothetical protein
MAIPRVWASVLGRSRLPLLSLCADLALHAATQRTSGVCRPRLRNEPNWRRARRRPEGGRQADRGTSAVRLGEAVRPQEPVRGRNRVRRDTSFAERIQPPCRPAPRAVRSQAYPSESAHICEICGSRRGRWLPSAKRTQSARTPPSASGYKLCPKPAPRAVPSQAFRSASGQTGGLCGSRRGPCLHDSVRHRAGQPPAGSVEISGDLWFTSPTAKRTEFVRSHGPTRRYSMGTTTRQTPPWLPVVPRLSVGIRRGPCLLRLCPSSCRSAVGRIGGDQWRSVVHQPFCETNPIRQNTPSAKWIRPGPGAAVGGRLFARMRGGVCANRRIWARVHLCSLTSE